MKIFRGDPASWNPDRTPYAVAIGVFDGVHRGHMAVFEALRSASDDLDVCALTFGSLPEEIVSANPAPPLLTTIERRIELLEESGLDAVGIIDFDDDIRHLSPAEFVELFLVRALNAGLVAVGQGFRFGYDASGSVDDLRLLGGNFDFDVVETQIVNLHGTEVRSSAIRAAIATGSVELAARMLGRPFEIEGSVVTGDERGRSIGFPTANITTPAGLVQPAGGVYAVRCVVDGQVFDGVANVGTRPTFGGVDETIEVHLYDMDIDLYDKTVRVQFIDRIRNEQRFTSVDALVAQIEADIEVAKRIFAS
ncbi:MAG: bifunctional riboflavin kinase/FAD synthetase [Armatimonadetes bacterium]|nr:MAG: bifunctional riboflavin kinase/FAD synthetase [Armatimonadota bacterium]